MFDRIKGLSDDAMIRLLKIKRPPCVSGKKDDHTMITYSSLGIKECCDCGHKEPLIKKEDD